MMASAFGSSVFDRKGIDGVVDGSAYGTAGVGRFTAGLQSGKLQQYAAATILLALGVFTAYWLILGGGA